MAVYGFPDRGSYDRMAKAVRRMNELPARVGAMRIRAGASGSGLVAAIANGSIGPDATGTVFLADSSFAATATTRDVTNDMGVTIPDGTKCYIARVHPLDGWRVAQARLCTEDA